MDEERLNMFNITLVILETVDHIDMPKLQIFIKDLMTREWNECLKYEVKTAEEFFRLLKQINEMDETGFFRTIDEKDSAWIAWDFVAMQNGMIAYKLSNTGKILQKSPKDLHKYIKLIRHVKYKREGEIG